MKDRVLIVDDEPAIAESLRDLLASWGYEAAAESNGFAGLQRVETFQPSVVITDVLMPQMDGFGLLREVRARYPETAVILLTGEGSVEMAVRAIREEGAYHYFEKPIDLSALRLVVERAVEYGEARRENKALWRQLRDHGAFGELVGISEPMRRIYSLIEQIAPSSASVLILGESGTGKELVARTIHNMSPRRNASFQAINCLAIPETLMESELFGHEKGAFTGAVSRRQGCFELANSGTLLLDEIAEMPVFLQAKLLRVLEERSIRRLGGSQEIAVDVRLLAATNKDPHEAVKDGAFREDLLYRLNVISIELPPLRKRKEDLPLLAQYLVTHLSERHKRPARYLSGTALDALHSYNWPGNVRELRNIIERAVIISAGEQIDRQHLNISAPDQPLEPQTDDHITLPVGTSLGEVERRVILRTLLKTDNNKTRAAEILQISLKTLHNKLRLYKDQGLLID
ncbi:MAG: sigma-54 dependent transcriptional regulator [Pyrinomonadaceae bacterium]